MAAPDPPTVLVIEDERELAEMYERWLGGEYEVRRVHDGETALEHLDADVDVVILDRIIPGLSGDEVLSGIESKRLGCRVAIVSAVEPDFDVVEMGFDEYLTKPVSGSELLAVVEKLLKRNEYTDRMQEYFSLVSKKALLESTKPGRERRASERYADLLARIDELESTVSSLRADLLENDDVAVAFRDLASRGGRD